MVEIKPYHERDWVCLWPILRRVFEAGDSFPNDPATTEPQGHDYWIEQPQATFVAHIEGAVVGSYHLKKNQMGLGGHVANAGYVVACHRRGEGVGMALAEHSLHTARREGFLAMQFNLVVATNSASLALWQRLSFRTLARLPNAFNHKQRGLVDAFILHRFL